MPLDTRNLFLKDRATGNLLTENYTTKMSEDLLVRSQRKRLSDMAYGKMATYRLKQRKSTCSMTAAARRKKKKILTSTMVLRQVLHQRREERKGRGKHERSCHGSGRQHRSSLDSNDDDDILRAEWSRSRARVRRAAEEVALLREEMNRVLLFLEWTATQWGRKSQCSK